MTQAQYIATSINTFASLTSLCFAWRSFRARDWVNACYWPLMACFLAWVDSSCRHDPGLAITICRCWGILWVLFGSYFLLRYRVARANLAASPWAYPIQVAILCLPPQPWYRRGIFRNDIADAVDAIDLVKARADAGEQETPDLPLLRSQSLTERHAEVSEYLAWGSPPQEL